MKPGIPHHTLAYQSRVGWGFISLHGHKLKHIGTDGIISHFILIDIVHPLLELRLVFLGRYGGNDVRFDGDVEFS